MKVMHLSPVPIWDVEEKSGMPSIYWGLKGFVDAGHDVMYVYAGKQDRHYSLDGIAIREFKMRALEIPETHIWLHRLANKLKAVIFFIQGSRQGIALSRGFAPDVIYGHFHAAPIAWLIGRVRGIPNITRIFGTFLFPDLRSFLGRWRKVEELLTFRVPCDCMIVTNDGTRGDECARALGVPEDRLKFWINGVDKAMYDPAFDRRGLKASLHIPAGHQVILTVSRLAGWKRVDRLISALPGILARHPDVTVVIVGDGEARADLESMVARLNLQPNVRFVGSVLHDRVADFMNTADLFVSLYDFSNVGNPLLEALCCGKCIVSVSTGSTGRIIRDGETGVLLDTAGLARLPEVIVGLLEDDAARARLGAAARAYAVTELQTWPERMAMEVRCVETLVADHVTARRR